MQVRKMHTGPGVVEKVSTASAVPSLVAVQFKLIGQSHPWCSFTEIILSYSRDDFDPMLFF